MQNQTALGGNQTAEEAKSLRETIFGPAETAISGDIFGDTNQSETPADTDHSTPNGLVDAEDFMGKPRVNNQTVIQGEHTGSVFQFRNCI